jgi:predicted phage-related endonuclease
LTHGDGKTASLTEGAVMLKIPKPEHGSQEWLDVRHRDYKGRVTFGASEAGALMGVSEYQNLMGLCEAKLAPQQTPKPPTPAMRKGVIFEDALGLNASEFLGVKLVQPDVMYRKDRFTATLDFIEPLSEQLIVECKVTSAYSVETGQDLPASWLMQGHVQHLVTGAEVWFSVFDKYQQLSVVRMPLHTATLDALQEQSERVAADLDKGIIPDEAWMTASAQQIAKLKPMHKGEVVECDDTVLGLVRELFTAKAAAKSAKENEKRLVDDLARIMGSAEAIESNGDVLMTWREQKGRTSFDQDRLKADHPDIFEQYVRQGSPMRVMRMGKNV